MSALHYKLLNSFKYCLIFFKIQSYFICFLEISFFSSKVSVWDDTGHFIFLVGCRDLILECLKIFFCLIVILYIFFEKLKSFRWWRWWVWFPIRIKGVALNFTSISPVFLLCHVILNSGSCLKKSKGSTCHTSHYLMVK